MFLLGFLLGVTFSIAFLIGEHLFAQLDRRKFTQLATSIFMTPVSVTTASFRRRLGAITYRTAARRLWPAVDQLGRAPACAGAGGRIRDAG
jgi:hypothetical protein